MEQNTVRNRRVELFQVGMLVLNCFAVMALCLFICYTTAHVRESYSARDFLGGVSAIPRQPVHNAIFCALLLCCLVATYILRRTVWALKPSLCYATFVADLVMSFVIVFILNFNYNGILLYVFANMVAYAKGNRLRYVFMMVAVLSFLMADYELMSINYPLYSVRQYIAYYESGVQSYLFSVYNVMSSMNIILFILYCIFFIFRQQGTIDEVNVLYQRLSEANRHMEAANRQLQEYAAVTEKMGEARERNRLAREIHDTLGHTLTGISAGVDACITMLDKSPEDTRHQLEVIARVTREGISDVRRSVNTLRTDEQERFPLEHAITRMITDITAVTGAKVYFVNRIEGIEMSQEEENAIYRVVQESLTNAVRHGQASEIWVELQSDGHDILLSVVDNGIGCAQVNSGFGTRHIRERMEMLGGSVTFDGSKGFRVLGRIPMRWGNKA